MLKLGRLFSRFAAIVVVGGLSLGACLAALIPGIREIALAHHYTGRVDKLRDLAQVTTVYDSQGQVIGRLGTQFRETVALDQVPKVMQEAVISAEDKTFWKNPGIDVGGSFRAFMSNVTSGKVEQGGSTITQQLVKNRLLSPKRDINRKIKELVLAYRLNDKYTKKEILEQYLNTVYFGQGSYGIKAATNRFFLVADPSAPYGLRPMQLDELTLGDAALLAGLIRNPEGDNPFLHPDHALKRRTEVLDSMVKLGYVTQQQADAANHEPLPDSRFKPPAELRPENAWVERAQKLLLNDPRLGATAEERRNKLLQGGLKIYTTEDPNLQAQAQQAVSDNLLKGGFGIGFVAMDPQTGAVRAMADSRPFSESKFNLPTDGVGEQMGSTWKMVTLATALSNGYSPNDTVDGTSPCSVKGHDGATQNAEAGGGTLSIRDATAESVNCAFVRISTSVGLDKVTQMAQKMGIRDGRGTSRVCDQNGVSLRQSSLCNEWNVLTLTLGVVSATPLEMATVTSTVASGGVRHDPIFVQKVVAPDGQVLFDESGRPGERVLDPNVASCEQDILRGVFGPNGTANGRDVPFHTVAGKTGTNTDKHGAAFGGFSQQLAAFVWYGIPDAPNTGDAGFGAEVPASTWQDFMKRALANQPDVAFPDPGPLCDLPGKQVIDTGGRGADVAPPPKPVPVPTDTTPDTTPAVTTPPTAPPTTPAPPPAPPVTPPPATQPPPTITLPVGGGPPGQQGNPGGP